MMRTEDLIRQEVRAKLEQMRAAQPESQKFVVQGEPRIINKLEKLMPSNALNEFKQSSEEKTVSRDQKEKVEKPNEKEKVEEELESIAQLKKYLKNKK